jgi:hypothetical protein
MTAVARLAAVVDMTETAGVAETVVIPLADARELLAVIYDTCPDHEACAYCGAPYCEYCGIGALLDCWDAHCSGCAGKCSECGANVQYAMEAEQGDADRDEGAVCP